MRDSPRRLPVERASYALPKGAPALQDGPLQTRRDFVLIAVGSVGLIGSAGFLVGRTSSPSARSHAELLATFREMQLAWAESIARGPEEDLLSAHITFLSVVELNESRSELWPGVERLAQAALSQTGQGAKDLVNRLLLTLRSTYTPTSTSVYILRLEEHARSLGERGPGKN